MTHVQILSYPGWAACELDRSFAQWLLQRHRAAMLRLSETPMMLSGPLCPACVSAVRGAIFPELFPELAA